MKIRKIRTKMLAFILPVILIAMGLMTFISANKSMQIIDDQISDRMKAELDSKIGEIENYLNVVMSSAANLSITVGSTYKETDLKNYETALKEMISLNDLVLGAGIWFEPFVYDEAKEYVGPYVYKDGANIATTYDYSNAEYDYHKQEYYTITKNSNKPIITDPYYDETSGMFMSSCTKAIYDGDKYIGCVTVDIELGTIDSLVENIKVGEQGKAFLINKDGVYLAGVEQTKIENAINISSDENSSLKVAGDKIKSNTSGNSKYVKGEEEYNLYHDTVSIVDWKLIIEIPQQELNKPVIDLVRVLIIVCIVAIILSTLSVLVQVLSIATKIKKVQVFSSSLAAGDFTIPKLKLETHDELGKMGDSLNEMFVSNKEVISNIFKQSNEIDISSKNLNSSADELLREFKKIETYMAQVNEAMMSASAATEQVNASSEEVDASLVILENETRSSKEKANQIRNRAFQVKDKSQNSYNYATNLSVRYEEELEQSIENAKVVDTINQLARVISGIAEQINLLSLNASIEAARAGEQGKGFAVVASEIGKLANDTSSAVSQIQTIINKVQIAVDNLTDGSKDMLGFVKETVTPDYNDFVGVAEQYVQDAKTMEDTSVKIAEMASNINRIMSEVTQAIQNIAESSQTTADNSSSVMESVEDVSIVVEHVLDMSAKQKEVSSELNEIVNRFKL